MTRRHQLKGPVDESNRHLAVQIAKLPQRPEAVKPKGPGLPLGAVGLATVIVIAIAWVAFWTLAR